MRVLYITSVGVFSGTIFYWLWMSRLEGQQLRKDIMLKLTALSTMALLSNLVRRYPATEQMKLHYGIRKLPDMSPSHWVNLIFVDRH